MALSSNEILKCTCTLFVVVSHQTVAVNKTLIHPLIADRTLLEAVLETFESFYFIKEPSSRAMRGWIQRKDSSLLSFAS